MGVLLHPCVQEMKPMNWNKTLWRVVGAAALMGAVQGCDSAGVAREAMAGSAESEMLPAAEREMLSAPERSLAQGVTTLEMSPGLRGKVAYRAGQRVIYVETRRQPTPFDVLAADPTRPAFGVDVKVTDREGALLYARLSGDGAEWLADAPVSTRAGVEQGFDLGVAREALSALSAPSATALGGQAERDAVQEALATLSVQASKPGPVAPEGAPAAASLTTATTYKHRVELWSKSCCVPGGYHSATRVASWNGSAWVGTVDFCNHGTCPNTGGMTQQCSFTSAEWRSGLARARQCSTPYTFASVWGHNCNDDAHLQVIDVRHNRLHSTSQGSCNDVGANPTPDGCNPAEW